MTRSPEENETIAMLLDADYIATGDYFVHKGDVRLRDPKYFTPEGEEITGSEAGRRYWEYLRVRRMAISIVDGDD